MKLRTGPLLPIPFLLLAAGAALDASPIWSARVASPPEHPEARSVAWRAKVVSTWDDASAAKLSDRPNELLETLSDRLAPEVLVRWAVDPEVLNRLRPRVAAPPGSPVFELHRWVEIRASPARAATVEAMLRTEPLVEHVEPVYPHEIAAIPNDPYFLNQAIWMVLLELPQAHDVVRGEQGNVVVAIVDGGTDWRHPDLRANVWRNPGEIPENGIDDDGNGFVDDVHGWNFSRDTADPTGNSGTPFNASHGTHVAGIVAATSNNGRGTAGVSWNARYMPINAADPEIDRIIAHGYDGMLYAAAMGADVINCSWGRPGPGATRKGAWSEFEAAVLRTVTEMGSLVVVAAGNNGKEDFPFYPAIYPQAIAVASVNSGDLKVSPFSNRDYWVDVSAPGQLIYSTVANDTFALQSGTSMAAPMVSGVAALAKTLHPEWSPAQLAQQIRWTLMDLEPSNSGLGDKLGGLVSGAGAVSRSVPGLWVSRLDLKDEDGDGLPEGGEVITFGFELRNELADATSSILVRLRSEDPYLVPLEDTVRLNLLPGGDSIEVSRGLSAWVRHEVPPAHLATVRLEIEYAGQVTPDVFYPELSPLQATLHSPTIEMSHTATGKVGFSQPTRAYDLGGIGLRRPGELSVLVAGGLIVADGRGRVSDAVQAAIPADTFEDFRPIQGQGLDRPPGRDGASELVSVYSDRARPDRLGISVRHRSLLWEEPARAGFVLSIYELTSQLDSLRGLAVGILVDWALGRAGDRLDRIRVDPSQELLWVEDATGSSEQVAGMRVLEGPGEFRAAWLHDLGPRDNPQEPYLYDLEDLRRKISDVTLAALMAKRPDWGSSESGRVASVVAKGAVDLAPGSAVRFAVAWLVAQDEIELREAGDRARIAWETLREGLVDGMPARTTLLDAIPNPFNPRTEVRLALPVDGSVRLDVYDARGRWIRSLVDSWLPAGVHRIGWDGTDESAAAVASGVYRVLARTAGGTDRLAVTLIR